MFTRFAVATLSQQMRVRIYTPADRTESGYRVDNEFSAAHPKRRIWIRASEMDELENGSNFAQANDLFGLYLSKPPLFVLVFASGNGVYRIFPIYRGEPFFEVINKHSGRFAICNNDEATLALFDECDLRGGVDHEAMKEWERKWNEAMSNVVASQQFRSLENGGVKN